MKQKKNQKGITLISLVISIIVMLILAGVSINATIGENGLITKTKIASIATRISQLKEELEMNIVGAIAEDKIHKREEVTVFGTAIRKYIPSVTVDEIENYVVIGGELYYIGDDEIYKQASEIQGVRFISDGQTREEFLAQLEGSAIDSIVKNSGENAFQEIDENGITSLKGVQLFDKSFSNSNKWKIIIESDNEKNVLATYGTDWYYVEKGTEIENIGVLKYDYIINYNIGDAVKFDNNKHAMLSWDSSLAVSEDLLFAIDPAIIESANAGDNTWANGLAAYGYNSDYSDAFSNVGMKFDGEDDFLKIPGNMGKIGEKGFTFEFYGIPASVGSKLCDVTDTEADENGEIPLVYKQDVEDVMYTYKYTKTQDNGRTYQIYNNKMTGFLGFGEADYGIYNIIKFLFRNDSLNQTLAPNQIGNIYFNYGRGVDYLEPLLDENGNIVYDEENNIVMTTYYTEPVDSEGNRLLNGLGKPIKTADTLTPWSTYLWAGTGSDYWNQCLNLPNYNINLSYGEEIYYSIVIDPAEDTQSIYLNGELIDKVQLNTRAWKGLQQYIDSSEKDAYWYVGRATENSVNIWNTFCGEIYAMRIYERPLLQEELKANYNATIAYHNIMLDSTQGESSL